MWIRSIDKERLKRVDSVFYEKVDNKHYLIGCTGGNEVEGCILGEYKDKEQVLKVIDIIELHIQNGAVIIELKE